MLGGGPRPAATRIAPSSLGVQGRGVRLVIQSGTPDMRRRRVIEKLFLDHVLIEPGDGAQVPGLMKFPPRLIGEKNRFREISD